MEECLGEVGVLTPKATSELSKIDACFLAAPLQGDLGTQLRLIRLGSIKPLSVQWVIIIIHSITQVPNNEPHVHFMIGFLITMAQAGTPML